MNPELYKILEELFKRQYNIDESLFVEKEENELFDAVIKADIGMRLAMGEQKEITDEYSRYLIIQNREKKENTSVIEEKVDYFIKLMNEETQRLIKEIEEEEK